MLWPWRSFRLSYNGDALQKASAAIAMAAAPSKRPFVPAR
jgi:hypothetical protein